MEIDITRFVNDADPFEFSASLAERGGHETWRNAVAEGESSPLLTTPEQLDALRAYMKGFGAWDDEEIAAWTDAECNAIFIQLISGDMREAGNIDLDDFDWEAYEADDSLSHTIFLGDDGRIYYYLGN